MAVNGEDYAIILYPLLFSFQQPKSNIEIITTLAGLHLKEWAGQQYSYKYMLFCKDDQPKVTLCGNTRKKDQTASFHHILMHVVRQVLHSKVFQFWTQQRQL